MGGYVLVHIIKPVDDVEEGENHWEEYAGPPIYGIHISQVGNGDFQLGGASPQAAFLLCHVPFQGIIGQHCAPWVSKSHHSLGGGHFIFYLKSAQ